MKVIIGTSIVSTTAVFTILFMVLGLLLTSYPQFVYAQTTDNNETSEDALEELGKTMNEIFSGKSKSSSNISQSIYNAENADLEEYKNKILGIQFKYPSTDWVFNCFTSIQDF